MHLIYSSVGTATSIMVHGARGGEFEGMGSV